MTTPDPAQHDALLTLLSGGADCRRRRVAAVIEDATGAVVGRGWNALPQGSCTAGDCPRGLTSYSDTPAFSPYEGNCEALHAETSAIKEAGSRAAGGTIYVTCEPCPGCAGAIAAAGLAHVIVRPPSNTVPTPARR